MTTRVVRLESKVGVGVRVTVRVRRVVKPYS